MKSFGVPIFGARIYFTRDRGEAQKWLTKRRFEETLDGLDGSCNDDNGAILVFVKNEDPALLCHECFHAANYALNYSSIESRDEELLAHLLQWIMERCLK